MMLHSNVWSFMTMTNTFVFRSYLHSGFTSGSSLHIYGILRSRITMVRRGQKPKLSISRSKKKRSVGCWIHILYSYKSGLSFLAWGLFRACEFLSFLVPCSVLLDITLPSDIEGSTLDLNEEGGTSSPPCEEIYSSDSFRAWNNLLTGQLNEIVEEISSLQREEIQPVIARESRILPTRCGRSKGS
ncbi:putative phosphite transport system-binding protein HtxB [Bienertia sinuspersici]